MSNYNLFFFLIKNSNPGLESLGTQVELCDTQENCESPDRLGNFSFRKVNNSEEWLHWLHSAGESQGSGTAGKQISSPYGCLIYRAPQRAQQVLSLCLPSH